MSLLEQAKRESKRLLKNIAVLKQIKEIKDYPSKIVKTNELYAQLKGFSNYEKLIAYCNNSSNNKYNHIKHLINSLEISFNVYKLEGTPHIDLMPMDVCKPLNKTSIITIPGNSKYKDNYTIVDNHDNYLLLEDTPDILSFNLKKHQMLFITDSIDFDFKEVGLDRILKQNSSTFTLDPINPLIDDEYSMKLYFGDKVYKCIIEILSFIKENEKTVDIKNLDKLFNLKYWIELSKLKNQFPNITSYLKNLMGDDFNINEQNLFKHYQNCEYGLKFSEFIKITDCFGNNPSDNFYATEHKLAVLLQQIDENSPLFNSLVIHLSLRSNQLISQTFSQIIFHGTLDYLKNLGDYELKNILFAPIIDKNFYKKDFLLNNVVNLIFNTNIDLDKKNLPLSFKTKMVKKHINKNTKLNNIDFTPYRNVNNFKELKCNDILYIRFHFKNYVYAGYEAIKL